MRALLLVALLAVALPAQVIGDVSPTEGTIGTVVTITGSGLGAKKPKIRLQPDAGGKPARLKVLSWSHGEVVAEIRKASVAGPATLVVKVGKGEASAPFEVRAPVVTSVVPSVAAPGQLVDVMGDFFGTKKVKAGLFGMKLKVVDSSDDHVRFKVPRKAVDGDWAVRVQNKLGADWSDAALTIVSGKAPKADDFLVGRINGAKFKAEDMPAADLGFLIAFDAMQSGGKARQLSVVLGFEMDADDVPMVFSGSGSGVDQVFYRETEDGASTVWEARPGVHPWQVSILGRSGQTLFGTIDAAMERVLGEGPDMAYVADGAFAATPSF